MKQAPLLRVIPHKTVPFVLTQGVQINKSVFEFLQNLHVRGMSAQTIRAYAYDLLAFYRFMGEQPLELEDFVSQHVTEFILFQRHQHASPRTINRRLTVLRTFLNHLKPGCGEQVFQTQSCFYKGVKNKSLLGPLRIKKYGKSLKVKVPMMLMTPLSSAEIQKFLLGLRTYRDVAIVHLMLFCGLRSCEVLSLEIDDIDLMDDQLRIRGKGQKERILPLSPFVRKALVHYMDYERPPCSHVKCFVVLKGHHRSQPLSPEGLRKLFRHQRQNKDLKRAHAHLFRHTFATNLIRENVSLPVVQKLMGHSDIEVTMGYIHLSLSDVSKEYHRAINALQNSCETDETK